MIRKLTSRLGEGEDQTLSEDSRKWRQRILRLVNRIKVNRIKVEGIETSDNVSTLRKIIEQIEGRLEKSLNNSLETFADFLIKEAGGRRIVCVTSDPSLLHPEEEIGALIELLNKKLNNKSKAEGITLEDFLKKLLHGERDLEGVFVYRDFTINEALELILESQEIRKLIPEDKFKLENFQQQTEESFERLSAFLQEKIEDLGIKIFNPLETWRFGERNWPYVIGITSEENPFVPEIIRGEILEIENERLYKKEADNRVEINPSEYVLKIFGTYGGGGVNLKPKIDDIKKAINEKIPFVLERKVPEEKAPVFLQPVIITPRKITDPDYKFRPSLYLGKFTCDVRIMFWVVRVNGKIEIIPFGILARENYPDRPDNLGSGGGVMPVLVVDDEIYDERINQFYELLFEIFKNKDLYQLFFWLLQDKFGKRVYDRDILCFPIPLILPRGFIIRIIEKLKPIVERLENNIRGSFHLAFDTYLSF